MELLTFEVITTLVGKTIYWKIPEGKDGITTILSISEKEIKTETVSGAIFDLKYVNKAVYKSYGRFIKA